MRDFNVRVVEDDANINIYTNVSRISIVDDVIMIDYEDGDERAVHSMDRADEITIKANH